MKHKELIAAFIGRTLNKSADEVAALLIPKADDVDGSFEPTVLEELLKHDVTRVQGFTTKNQEFFDNGVKKAQKETLEKFEKQLKEKFDFTEDKKGLDLIDAIVMAKIKSQGGELDEEKIKKSETYLKTVDRLQKEKEEALANETTKFKDLESSIQKQEIAKNIRSKAREIILELNPVLPEGKTSDGKSKADIQVEKLINELLNEYTFETKGEEILISKENKLLEDVHSNRIDFKKFVTEKASSNWDFKEGESKKGTGNSNDNANSQNVNKYKGPALLSADDYTKAIQTAKSDDEKIEITKVWNENPANKL